MRIEGRSTWWRAPQGIGVALACWVFLGVGAPPAARAAVATMIVDVRTSGGTAAERAAVAVYHLPANRPELGVGARGHLPLLATGATDATGRFSTALDTSRVEAEQLADVGSGARDAFNVLVVARDAERGLAAVTYGVARLGASSRVTAVASEAPRLSPVVRTDVSPLGDGPSCVPGVCYSVEAHRYRYVRIAALNASEGLRATLVYATADISVRQSRIGVAIRYVPMFGSGFWEAGGMMLERTDRTTVAPFRRTGPYHRYVWANYKEELRHYWSCDLTVCTQWDAWEPLGFAGQLTDDNPNEGPDSPRIGIRTYAQAPFPSNPNHSLKITSATSGWTRSQGQYMVFSWTLDAAGFLQLGALATYGSSTSVRFDKVGGCDPPEARFLYGASESPALTPIVEARCLVA